eukprot:gnl/Dysnectes_brevis/751_a824_3731.p1 GENE.gnl/Dysnectes_brevis/751_a824_3731~~gnl/Dysnectes_brevis/751_a824_3731.p1  ORF type:complete len:220 (+),score=31.95 gnl/Dysnectes_brevis/751_a824_3731:30-662(+)
MSLDDKTRQNLYRWVDGIPLSRPKRNICRDFADGVMMAEVINYFLPRLVEVHNYSPANSVSQKKYNWQTLQHKVLRKLRIRLTEEDIDALVTGQPGAVERTLLLAQKSIADYKERAEANPSPVSTRRTPSKTREPSSGHSAPAPAPAPTPAAPAVSVDQELLVEKEGTIQDLREANEILQLKVRKLQQLVRLKDSRIQALSAKLGSSGLL